MNTAEFAGRVAHGGWMQTPVHYVAAALTLVAVGVGAYFATEALTDDGDSAAPAAVTATQVGPEADVIGRFAASTDFQAGQAELDASARYLASSDYAQTVRDQDAILRLAAANASSSFDVRDQDAILRTAVAADPATEDAIFRLGPVSAGSPAGPEDAILRLAANDRPTNTEDAITRMAAN
jgi:hypothetical protein